MVDLLKKTKLSAATHLFDLGEVGETQAFGSRRQDKDPAGRTRGALSAFSISIHDQIHTVPAHCYYRGHDSFRGNPRWHKQLVSLC